MPSQSNILLVDDEEDIAKLIKTVLEEDGFKVETFKDPLLALNHFKSYPEKFSVVVSDVRMPGISDIELIAHIKKLKPKVNAMLMTAFDMDYIKPDLEKYDYEIVEIFQKPLSIKKLCEIIKRQLENEKILK